ncbi:dATP/dGTP pyrophosphohydrolase domain-containing protein [Citrobacter freundii]|uniref:dATP/dGTP pyrophosphohydrolase domain-containing protein n=1 Tax=Citrobacter freundii TaxID=546 RepID=UPI003B97167E
MEEVLRISDRDHEAWHKARNGIVSCRAAMLQGSQPVSNRDELREQVRREHAEWSDKTFGNVGPVGPLKHLSKEALEAAAAPDDLSEWADLQFLLWDAQRRAGISDGEITAAMEEKLKVNMARQWPEPKDGEPRMHIKETGNSPVTPDRWIPVSERLPESNGVYFGWDGKRVLEVNCFFGGFSANQFIHGEITHWMPLPAAPQQEAE